MAKSKAEDVPRDGAEPDPFERGRKLLIVAGAAIVSGLGVAGSVDRSTGGVLLLTGWLMGIAALHRLGRAGSDRTKRTQSAGANAP